MKDKIKQLRKLMDQLTELNGNKTPDTKEPIFYGTGIVDVRVQNDSIQIGIQTELGWIVTVLPVANATLFAANIASLAGGVLMASSAKTNIPPDNITLH